MFKIEYVPEKIITDTLDGQPYVDQEEQYIITNEDGSYVAQVWTRDDDHDYARKNAILLKAAPKLLEALKEIHKAIGNGDPVDIANVCASYVIPAIAEAESEG